MKYELIRSSRKTITAQIKQGRLIVRAPMEATDEDISAFLLRHKKWIETHMTEAQARTDAMGSVRMLSYEQVRDLADRAMKVIPKRVAHYAPLIGVTYGRITIRAQHSRWGSCSSKGNLNFNCLLMLAPPEVLDCVVVHELCHRKEMNHSSRFYEQVIRVFPDYWKWDLWLKENGDSLMMLLGA